MTRYLTPDEFISFGTTEGRQMFGEIILVALPANYPPTVKEEPSDE